MVKQGNAILEIAPGSGYVSIELVKVGQEYRITGMDLSADFVGICRANAAREQAAVDFVQGNVSAMPFAENQFDYPFCSAVFKNFHDPPARPCGNAPGLKARRQRAYYRHEQKHHGGDSPGGNRQNASYRV